MSKFAKCNDLYLYIGGICLGGTMGGSFIYSYQRYQMDKSILERKWVLVRNLDDRINYSGKTVRDAIDKGYFSILDGHEK